ncbi:MAG: phosphoribosyltransferase [Thainema sp.]
MPEIFVTWPDYHQKIEHLAKQIYDSGWEFNQVICLAKGGLRVGDIIARIYDVPLAILATSSYGGTKGQTRGAITFANDLTKTTANLGSHVLLVDDLVDSGITLQKSLVWLDRRYGFYVEEVRTAVLWYKDCSVIEPDYYVDFLPNNPWIHQPFEPYEHMHPADLQTTPVQATE